MTPFSEMAHNPLSERMVNACMKKNGNIHDSLFYRVMCGFYICQAASMMRTSVIKYDKQIIPVNMYALNLMPSGFGKGLAANLIENNMFHAFKEKFLEDTFPIKATESVTRIAAKRAVSEGIDEEEALEKTGKDFTDLGKLLYSFDSGTVPALKQYRTKLLMARAGAMNFHIDEIGSNLLKNQEMLETYLELFDVGRVKQKLIKNTAENVRMTDMDGATPGNLLMFGTPSKLLDGGRIEALLQEFFDTGYARRCFFGLVDSANQHKEELTAEEIFDNLMSSNVDQDIEEISEHFDEMAEVCHFGKVLPMSREVSIELIAYQQLCKKRSAEMPAHNEVGKAEMLHRFFKAMKLAGAYAWADMSQSVSMQHLHSAILLAEESGEAFRRILSRDKNYVRLAKYIAHAGAELTQADIVEDCPYYKGTQAAKNEMMQLAIAWGYKNNVVIKKTYNEGIEFISGESLDETDLNKLIFSHSPDKAYNYENEYVPFDRLHELTQIPHTDGEEYNWCNHHLNNGHRVGTNAIRGFNMIVIDVDEGCSYETAKMLMADYKFHIYTTKSHNKPGKGERFRIVLPISHVVKLSGEEFKEFMRNVFEWLPFVTDEGTGQRVCKWASNEGEYAYNDGEILDALQFIPATTKNEQRQQAVRELENLENLERWFAMRMTEGQRNKEMLKYTLMLVDSGMALIDVEQKVRDLNSKLKNPLAEEELGMTVFTTAARRFEDRIRESVANS